MRVSGILHAKGHEVATIAPTATVAEAAEALHRNRIGALVVTGDGTRVEGVVSERDIARHLATGGWARPEAPVAQLMSTDVVTCAPTDTIDGLMAIMTDRRIRHIPVVRDGALAGLISIGDVVKWRLDELETETRHLMDYIATGR